MRPRRLQKEFRLTLMAKEPRRTPANWTTRLQLSPWFVLCIVKRSHLIAIYYISNIFYSTSLNGSLVFEGIIFVVALKGRQRKTNHCGVH